MFGSTLGCTGNYEGYCGIGIGSGPDVVYAIHPIEDGTMHLVLRTGGFTGVLYAFAPCDNASCDTCGNPHAVTICREAKLESEGSGFVAEVAIKVTHGRVYPVVVDGRDESSGEFELTAELEDPICGDGIIDVTGNPPEQCDFGEEQSCDAGDAGAPSDGCDPTCRYCQQSNDTEDSCPTQTRLVDVGAPVTIQGFTTGSNDDYRPCGAQAGGADRVVGISWKRKGKLTVDVTADFDVVLGAYTTCNALLDGLVACSDSVAVDPTSPEQISLDGDVGQTLFFVVDGYNANAFGAFTFTAVLEGN